MIVRALACFLALQGFVIAAGPALAEQTRDAAGWNEHTMAPELCNGRNDAELPHGGHSSCEQCMFCALGARGAALTVAALWCVTAISPPDPHSSIPPRRAEADDPATPIGWASSWSSRAPPALS